MKPTRKTALITGIGGQDGSYLAELLLDRGYKRLWKNSPLDRMDAITAAGLP